MRYIKIICVLAIACMLLPVSAKKPKSKQYGVYIAGVSASFTDSLVYVTPIQFVDSASLDSKGLLNGRAQYSFQLKDYLETEKGLKNRTCITFFNTKRGKLQKELGKLRAKYQKGHTLVVKDVDAGFTYRKAED